MLPSFIALGIIVAALLWRPYIRRTTKAGAPFVPTDPKTVQHIIETAHIEKGDTVYDLGSGDGRVVIAAALRGAQAYGVELDWLRYLFSRFWIIFFGLGQRAHILRKNFYDIDLSQADVVCLFLLQETNEKLKQKLEKELKKGARVVSLEFTFPGWKPKEVVPSDWFFGPIYYYVKE